MKHRPSALLALVWAGMWGLVFATPVNNAHGRNPASPPGSKLLYIMLDGFRWDYVDLQSAAVLPGFTKFLKEGVRARWTHPLFPSLSYPTWTSLVTGQYAENHGVVGNYFYDSATKEEFSLFDVYASLMKMTGVNVYKHNDIPEKYHFKNNKYVHEIVVSAEKGNFVMASHSDKQLPARSDFVYYGAHGYDPDVQDMKGIFFAKGPAFQKGKIIEPIHVVDVYQVLTHVLGLTPQPHNGTWNHVQDAFVQSTPATHDESLQRHQC
ncbi:hypothetical protein C7M84_013863 [Penaeus vannamei]|uniref:Ectonucleotide pyrophosphatase/phosphodiesterase family member 6 n=1 Tax=Penaeus vannamei TaxID=6689 RepID=A0A423SV17_PENVA|nr:hypothetical protein C7M84_013863 [Penaeus vannamei]